MMEDQELTDVESLTLCSFCKQKFNATDHCPKILVCKHYFCLKCIDTTMISGQELSCVHCWKRQEIADEGGKSLPTHTPVLSLAHHLTTLGFSDFESKDYWPLPCNPTGLAGRVLDNYNAALAERVGEAFSVKPKNTIGCSGHGLSWTLWCHTCQKPLCRMCFLLIEHAGHHVTSHNEARDLFHAEVQTELSVMSKLLQEMQRLSTQQREFQIQVLEACVALKTCVESDLAVSYGSGPDIREAKDLITRARTDLSALTSPGEIHAAFLNIAAEKQRLETRYQELAIQGKIEDAVSRSNVILDFPTLSAVHNSAGDWLTRSPNSPGLVGKSLASPHPILLLANYCMYYLYTRQSSKLQQQPLTLLRNPTAVSSHPRYYFNIELNSTMVGRFVIETRPDLAPKMSHNFGALCLNESGPSYKNCSIFQCWEGESIITGDYESNNGRGGKAIFDEGYFMPDETKMAAVRGAVGMRRTQKRHDNLGLVGSQFRVILQDMRGFSAIFGHVVEGIDVIEKIASCGDQTGKPTKSIIINACGQL